MCCWFLHFKLLLSLELKSKFVRCFTMYLVVLDRSFFLIMFVFIIMFIYGQQFFLYLFSQCTIGITNYIIILLTIIISTLLLLLWVATRSYKFLRTEMDQRKMKKVESDDICLDNVAN